MTVAPPPPIRHDWRTHALDWRGRITVVAVCVHCGVIRTAKVDEKRQLDLKGACVP